MADGSGRGRDAVLTVESLSVDALTPQGARRVIDGISFALAPGETLCLAGESGSGKSVTALSIMRLLPRASLRIAGGDIRLERQSLPRLPERAMRDVRGGEIAMIFQEPMTSLNPVHSIGAQLTEAIRIHQGAEGSSVEQRARDMLDVVHISDPARRMKQYPHELSGGMRQRVMIAMALSCRPKVLLADEPTTALDVTVQAQILKLMRELKREFGTAIILITHDMGVVAEMADRVAVMRDGRIVEAGLVLDIFERPQADYTRELLAAVPRLGAFAGTDAPPRVTATSRPPVPDGEAPVLSVKKLVVDYGASSSLFRRRASEAPAVQDVSFEIRPGRTLGLVGESGSGKSTTGKAVLGLVPFAGSVIIGGTSIHGLSAAAMRPVRRAAQMIFQDPMSSLNPRHTIFNIIAAPLRQNGLGDRLKERVAEALQRVGLPQNFASRYRHELSGGQRQRVGIARALALSPKFVLADEIVSGLDVSTQAQILTLLEKLAAEMGLTVAFISHDLSVIRRLCQQVVVMREGRIVEASATDALFDNPKETYTRDLLAAIPLPEIDPDWLRLKAPA
ncbi:ABC transporter ATP-binding protein [Mesorhizobium sp.]|uniref:ABC transporter ATP-binding protein n=2 Tax=Mesorhizobium sp. TaxID=1871066 RepID=UPI000FE618A8|nr:ABC transporter ATP-binding protein [Mesorhizobium sp.]RWF30694.1 MAG: ABC transporter ATP-binding protein [Mesorhizobium sp.]